MRFDSYFRVWISRSQQTSLKSAMAMAESAGITELVYDPLGLHDATSWWFVHTTLEVLRQTDLIREFDVLKPAPSQQQFTMVPGRVY